MKIQKVWVPGEPCDDGFIVTDAKTGVEFYVADGEVGDLDYPLGKGRFKTVKALRCVHLGTEGNYAVAKLPDSRLVHFKLVAGWQLFTGKMPSLESETLPELPESAA